MSLYRFLGCDDHENYFPNTQRHRIVSSRNSSPVHVLSEIIISWSEALLVISGVWDSCQGGIWQKEEGWGWCGQAGKWRGVHSSFPTARGQMLFICSLIWYKMCCFSSLTNIVFFPPSGPLSASEMWISSWGAESEAGSLQLLGPLVEMVQVSTSGPHQGVLWREDCTLLCLAG